MGFFGKLFDKKECSICGGEIGLLGNRKLEDGNCCKECARKLSPLFSDRRHSTVEEIKAQLAYRAENEKLLDSFHPDITYGEGEKVYVDRSAQKFIVTRMTKWRDTNPDLISFSQVIGIDTDIREHKDEIYYKDSEGKNQSYNPRRYEYEYEFKVVIRINSPWFDEVDIELSEGHRPDSRYSPAYREYEYQMNDLVSVLSGRGSTSPAFGQNTPPTPESMAAKLISEMESAKVSMMEAAGVPENVISSVKTGWVCESCGSSNTGKFCQNCGAKQPEKIDPSDIVCDKCSWTPAPGEAIPKFCPNCGDPINADDIN